MALTSRLHGRGPWGIDIVNPPKGFLFFAVRNAVLGVAQPAGSPAEARKRVLKARKKEIKWSGNVNPLVNPLGAGTE